MDTENRVEEESQSCERCGNPNALNIEGRWFCADCYSARSSCCPEFGPDDLWKEKNR
ncbi:MAG: hypothetical protein M9963_11645 [Kiritimatiellae bacterium]|nr:hypothetical protein [Kiritimatiellia bacterium]MCO5062623.1 hypothetical protein [Kiritimatiellia bacterium]